MADIEHVGLKGIYSDRQQGFEPVANGRVVQEQAAAAPAGGRIMFSLAGAGGLAGMGGIAGQGGGLAG